MSRYTAVTDADREAMLATIGVSSLEELFDGQIPDGVREMEVVSLATMHDLAGAEKANNKG